MTQQFSSLDDLEANINKTEETTVPDQQEPTVEEAQAELDRVIGMVETATEQANQNQAQSVVEEEKQSDISNLLQSIKIDLNNVSIVKETNPLASFKELDAIFTKPTFEVIALQSGYRSSFRALNNNDLLKIQKISGTEYEQNIKLLNIIFDHAENLSTGKIDFKQFLSVTAEADWDTLIYGIFCATYPKDTDYTIVCPHCAYKNKIKVGKHNLFAPTHTEEVAKYINDVVNRNYSAKDLIQFSMVNTKQRLILDNTKVLIDLVTPTIADYLTSLSRARNYPNIEQEIFGYIKHIGNIAIPNISALRQGKVEFIGLDNLDDKIKVIVDLPDSDKAQLETAISEKMMKYNVDYKIPDIKCQECSGEIKDIRVDVSDLLFKRIAGV